MVIALRARLPGPRWSPCDPRAPHKAAYPLPSHPVTSSLPIRLVVVLLSAILGLAALTPAAHANPTVDRLAGQDRVATSVEVARAGWADADHVLVATAVDYPDAVAAAALAGALQAPVLLTAPNALSPEVSAALAELETTTVTVLGGKAAVSPAVVRELRDRGLRTSRIAGVNRYETAARIAAEVTEHADVTQVAIALGDRPTGDAWPDALSAASLAGDRPVPTLLTATTRLPDATVAALVDLAPEAALVLGGKAAISDGVVVAVDSHANRVQRVRGSNRYATAVEVAQVAMTDSASADAVFVSGEDFADALSAGALATQLDAPLLLVPADLLDDEVDAFVRSSATAFERAFLVGGAVAVTEHVEGELQAAISGAPRPAPPPPPCPANSSPDCTYTYRIAISTWERLAQCESGGNWAISTGNGYYGGVQFSLGSWRAVGGTGYPHQNSKWEQIHRAERLQASQGWGAWPSCSRKMGLR